MKPPIVNKLSLLKEKVATLDSKGMLYTRSAPIYKLVRLLAVRNDAFACYDIWQTACCSTNDLTQVD